MWLTASRCTSPRATGCKAAIEAHRDYITAETLTVDLQFAAAPSEAQTTKEDFDGETLVIGLKKA